MYTAVPGPPAGTFRLSGLALLRGCGRPATPGGAVGPSVYSDFDFHRGAYSGRASHFDRANGFAGPDVGATGAYSLPRTTIGARKCLVRDVESLCPGVACLDVRRHLSRGEGADRSPLGADAAIDGHPAGRSTSATRDCCGVSVGGDRHHGERGCAQDRCGTPQMQCLVPSVGPFSLKGP